MATITEDYVSFETAKLLKEKGFPQEYDDYHALVYNEEDYEDEYEVQRMVLETKFVKAGTLSSYPVGIPGPKCYCPTLQMAMKWLRIKHHIDIEVNVYSKDHIGLLNYFFEIRKNGSLLILDDVNYIKDSYEEACEAAIKYCFEYLI